MSGRTRTLSVFKVSLAKTASWRDGWKVHKKYIKTLTIRLFHFRNAIIVLFFFPSLLSSSVDSPVFAGSAQEHLERSQELHPGSCKYKVKDKYKYKDRDKYKNKEWSQEFHPCSCKYNYKYKYKDKERSQELHSGSCKYKYKEKTKTRQTAVTRTPSWFLQIFFLLWPL